MKRNIFEVLRAGWRMFNGFCPECNCRGPEAENCPTCLGGNLRTGDAPPIEVWYRRYYQARCIHGQPMEGPCFQCNQMMRSLNSGLVERGRGPRRA